MTQHETQAMILYFIDPFLALLLLEFVIVNTLTIVKCKEQ
jgi:hypothetical protein